MAISIQALKNILRALFHTYNNGINKELYHGSFLCYGMYYQKYIMICSDCGSYMVGECGISGAKKKKYYYYKCSGAKNKKNCHRKAVRKFETEEKIINSIFKNIWNTDVIEEIADHVIAWQKHDNTVIPLLCKELNNIEKSLDNVMTAIEKGIITPTTKKRLNELETIKADIEIKIAKEEIQEQTLTKEHIIYWLTNKKKKKKKNRYQVTALLFYFRFKNRIRSGI